MPDMALKQYSSYMQPVTGTRNIVTAIPLHVKKIAPPLTLPIKYYKKQKFFKREINEYRLLVNEFTNLYPRVLPKLNISLLSTQISSTRALISEKNRRIKQFYRLQYPFKTNWYLIASFIGSLMNFGQKVKIFKSYTKLIFFFKKILKYAAIPATISLFLLHALFGKSVLKLQNQGKGKRQGKLAARKQLTVDLFGTELLTNTWLFYKNLQLRFYKKSFYQLMYIEFFSKKLNKMQLPPLMTLAQAEHLRLFPLFDPKREIIAPNKNFCDPETFEKYKLKKRAQGKFNKR